jgi:hypothetical protein
MEHFALRRVAYEAMAIRPAPFMRYQRTSRFVEADGAAFIRQDMGGPGFNWAAFVGEKGSLADLLETGEKVFAGSIESWGVLVEVEAEHPVEAEMRARGWTVAEEEPAFVLPAITPDFVCPGGLAIRPALAEPDRKAFSESVAKVFGVLPDGWESLTPTAASANDPDLSYLVGWEDDQPVAAAMMYRVGPTAVIAGVAPPQRRAHAAVAPQPHCAAGP